MSLLTFNLGEALRNIGEDVVTQYNPKYCPVSLPYVKIQLELEKGLKF